MGMVGTTKGGMKDGKERERYEEVAKIFSGCRWF